MNRNSLQQRLAGCIGLMFVAGGLMWVCMLIRGAMALRDRVGDAVYEIALGPLLLHVLSKKANGDAIVASLSFENGLIGFIGILLIAGILLAYGRVWRQRGTDI